MDCGSAVIRDSAIDGRRADALMPKVVLDELEVETGVQQVRGDRVPEGMVGQVAGKAGTIAIERGARLHLALS